MPVVPYVSTDARPPHTVAHSRTTVCSLFSPLPPRRAPSSFTARPRCSKISTRRGRASLSGGLMERRECGEGRLPWQLQRSRSPFGNEATEERWRRRRANGGGVRCIANTCFERPSPAVHAGRCRHPSRPPPDSRVPSDRPNAGTGEDAASRRHMPHHQRCHNTLAPPGAPTSLVPAPRVPKGWAQED